jgi:hypothetical protein
MQIFNTCFALCPFYLSVFLFISVSLCLPLPLRLSLCQLFSLHLMPSVCIISAIIEVAIAHSVAEQQLPALSGPRRQLRAQAAPVVQHVAGPRTVTCRAC